MPSIAPQHPVKPSSEEQQEKPAPVLEDRKQSQSVGELEQEGGVKTGAEESPINAGPEVKVQPEVRAESEVKVEPQVKEEPELKVEPEVEAEPELKVEPFSVKQDTPGEE